MPLNATALCFCGPVYQLRWTATLLGHCCRPLAPCFSVLWPILSQASCRSNSLFNMMIIWWTQNHKSFRETLIWGHTLCLLNTITDKVTHPPTVLTSKMTSLVLEPVIDTDCAAFYRPCLSLASRHKAGGNHFFQKSHDMFPVYWQCQTKRPTCIQSTQYMQLVYFQNILGMDPPEVVYVWVCVCLSVCGVALWTCACVLVIMSMYVPCQLPVPTSTYPASCSAVHMSRLGQAK